MQSTGALSDTILQIRGWSLDDLRMSYKMQLAYCPHGDLEEVEDQRFANGSWYRVKWIPESFIWYLFESLVKAGIAMERADPTNTTLYIHGDIKAGNIFLDSPNPNHYAHYPTPTLADFGWVERTSPADPDNPRLLSGIGTPGYRAPEQVRKRAPVQTTGQSQQSVPHDLQPAAVDAWQVLAPANVFNVGTVVLSSMDRFAGIDDDEKAWVQRKQNVPRFSPEAIEFYSKELRDLVLQCLCFKPQDRFTFARLSQLIEEHTGGDDPKEDQSKGMKTKAADDQDVEHNLRLWHRADRYAVYNKLTPGPPRPGQ